MRSSRRRIDNARACTEQIEEFHRSRLEQRPGTLFSKLCRPRKMPRQRFDCDVAKRLVNRSSHERSMQGTPMLTGPCHPSPCEKMGILSSTQGAPARVAMPGLHACSSKSKAAGDIPANTQGLYVSLGLEFRVWDWPQIKAKACQRHSSRRGR